MKWAQSIDGCLADDAEGWRWISSPSSRKYSHWLRHKYDAICIGAGTLFNDFPRLDVREIQLSFLKNPLVIIYDPQGKIFSATEEQQTLLRERTLSKSSQKIFLVEKNVLEKARCGSSSWIREIFNAEHMMVLSAGKVTRGEPITHVFQEALSSSGFLSFFGRPLQSILVEGGARLLSAFIDTCDFHMIHVFTAPFVLGGERHRLFSKMQKNFFLTEKSMRTVASVNRFHLLANAPIESDVLSEYIPESLIEQNIF